MGIEYVRDVTVVTVIADWTIEMVKRGLPDKRPAASDRHARCHADLSCRGTPHRIARGSKARDTSCVTYLFFFSFSRDNAR